MRKEFTDEWAIANTPLIRTEGVMNLKSSMMPIR